MTLLRWDVDGKNWPNKQASRFVEQVGFRWHVQIMGEGPDLLLLHGTGASTHSWREIAPLLAQRFRVIAPDLPGHGFTQVPSSHRFTLEGMSQAVASLLKIACSGPVLAVGHSAGAAILCRMALDKGFAPKALVSLNGALMPFKGIASHIFPAMAKVLFLNPLVPAFFSWRAHDSRVVKHLISGTGSVIDAEGLVLYARLFQSPAHVRAALRMMANWDLHDLVRHLPRLEPALTLIAGSGDTAVSADVAFEISEVVAGSRVILLRGVGHLAHEEKPRIVAAEILDAARRAGIGAIAGEDPSTQTSA